MIDSTHFRGLLTSTCVTCQFSGEVKAAKAAVNGLMIVTRTRRTPFKFTSSKVKNMDFILKCLVWNSSLHPV